ncbi:MAG: hypothetical protein IIY55_07930 [Blautia sp.]|nr:hypothetical protein [Blautia sp.]
MAGICVETVLVLPVFLFGMITMLSFLDIYRIQTVRLSMLCAQSKQAGLLEAEKGSAGREEMTLVRAGRIHLPALLLPLGDIPCENRVCVHCWTGRSGKISSGGGTDGHTAEQMVYITQTGHVIHSDPGCSYLSLSVHTIPGSSVPDAVNQYGHHYHGCEICSRGKPPGSVVYVTEDGDRYHNTGSCRGLKRTVLLVPESEVEGWKHCSRCGHE